MNIVCSSLRIFIKIQHDYEDCDYFFPINFEIRRNCKNILLKKVLQSLVTVYYNLNFKKVLI